MRLILFEWKKIRALRMLLITVTLIIVCGVGYSYTLENQDAESWRAFALAQKNEFQSLIDQTDPRDEFYNEACSVFQKEIQEINFCIDNNMPYGCQTVWSFLVKSKFLLGLVLFSAIILANNTFSVEVQGQMLEKIISKKHTRKELLKRKYIAIYAMVLTMLCASLIALFIVGIILYGHVDLPYLVSKDGEFPAKVNAVEELFLHGIAILLSALVYVNISVATEIMLPGKKGGIMVLTALIILNDVLVGLTERMRISKIFPFYYLDLNRWSTGSSQSEIILRILYLLGFIILIFLVTMFMYVRKKEEI